MGESFTIQISSNLVRHLVDDAEKVKKKTRKPKSKIPQEPPQSQTVLPKQLSDNSETHKSPSAGWPLQPPLFLPPPPQQKSANAELEAIRSVLEESEKTVQRLQKQEENMLQEVTQRAKDLHDKEFKLPHRKPMPCLDEKDACLKCYKEHVKDPLKCAQLVKDFADCARTVRQQRGLKMIEFLRLSSCLLAADAKFQRVVNGENSWKSYVLFLDLDDSASFLYLFPFESSRIASPPPSPPNSSRKNPILFGFPKSKNFIILTNPRLSKVMVRGRDACWEHCVLIDAARQKVRCNYCHREFSGGVFRMKFHLAQIRNKDIVPCTEVPNNVRNYIQSILSTPKKQKTPKRQKLEQVANDRQNSSSASGGALPSHGSSEHNGSVSPTLLFPHASPSEQPERTTYDVQKQKQDDADKKIALFFFYNAIPFNAATSMYYQGMIDAVAECGVGYKAPSSVKLRCNLLEKVKVDIDDMYKKLRDKWQETGCTILCNCWSDGRTKSLVVFSVTCPKGTIFLRSMDVSGHAVDPHYLFGLLESVVLEVGVESVVQVLTDGADSYAYAGKLLTDKYPSIFWSPCASYCVTKILEDFSKVEWVSTVLEEATTITKYIYSNELILVLMQKFTGGIELIRPKISRIIANFLSLRILVFQEEKLKHMFSHTEWLGSSASRHPDAQLIKSMLDAEQFWSSAHEAVSLSEPLLKILRMVEGDMPAMGYLYEGIERAKISIKAYYNGITERYLPIWDIIERRWNMQLHFPLHAAAAFLNPSIFYGLSFKVDSRMRNGFQESMMKLAVEDTDKVEITKEHPLYINAHGALGTEFATKGRVLNAPGDWWAAYGYEIPTLQRFAIRILCQPCSSHWCRWNWSNFETLHSRRLNRAEFNKLSDLVFVRCNLWLQEIFSNRQYKPIIFDEIDVCSEWPSESEILFPLSDDSLLENVPS